MTPPPPQNLPLGPQNWPPNPYDSAPWSNTNLK
jgi:hypothetical protein